MNELPDKTIYAISGASHQGLEPLLEAAWKVLEEEKESQKPTSTTPWHP
jgi:hypothetical protein